MMQAAESPENSVYLQQAARLYTSEDSNILYLGKINIFSFVPC